MEIELIDTVEGFRRLEPVWNETLAASDSDIPFMTFEWFSVWWTVYGKENDLLVLVLREAGEIVALAPLLRTRITLMGLPVRAIGFIDNGHADRAGLIVRKERPGLLRAVLDYLRRSRYRYDVVIFNAVEKHSTTERCLQNDLAENGQPFILAKGKESPYIGIDGTWEAYFKTRSKNVRHKMTRIGNAMKRQGRCEVVEYTDRDIDRGMAEMLAVSRNSWKYHNRTAIVSKDENVRFFSLLAETMAGRGWFRLWVLKINGASAAFQYALQYKKRLHGLKTDFDEQFSGLCPGKFLARHIVQQCFDEGLLEFDLLGHNESYKMEWTALCRQQVKYMIFSAGFYGVLLYTLKTRVIGGMKNLIPSVFPPFRRNAFTRSRGELQE